MCWLQAFRLCVLQNDSACSTSAVAEIACAVFEQAQAIGNLSFGPVILAKLFQTSGNKRGQTTMCKKMHEED
jgi:hypothetical protein